MGRIRLLPKKRGHRWSGSTRIGSLGEGFVFFGFLLLGACCLAVFVASRLVPIPGISDVSLESGMAFALMIVLTSLVMIGIGGLSWMAFRLGTTRERRSALAKRAEQLTTVLEPVTSVRDYPTIPSLEPRFRNAGLELAYRLPMRAAKTWSVLAAILFCLMWTGLFSIILVTAISYGWNSLTTWLLLPILAGLAYAAWKSTRFAYGRWRESVCIGRTDLEISALPIHAGETCELAVIQYRSRAIRNFSVTLACDEEVQFRDGTDLRIERRRVREIPLELHDLPPSSSTDPLITYYRLVCPSDAMHSFQVASSLLEWSAVMQGTTHIGIPFQKEFKVVVFPPRRPRPGRT